MDYLTYFNRINYILELIPKNQLHSPKDLSEKFDCSEKTVRNMINHLREMGYSITFCRKNGKYILENNYKEMLRESLQKKITRL